MGGTQESVDVSWEKLEPLLERMAIKLLNHLSALSVQNGNGGFIGLLSRNKKQVIRAAILHVLVWKANSNLKPAYDPAQKVVSAEYRDIDKFITYCVRSGRLVDEPPTLREIRLGKRNGKSGSVYRSSMEHIAIFISETLGEPISINDFLKSSFESYAEKSVGSSCEGASVADEIVNERIGFNGVHSQAAFGVLKRSFERWPELAEEMRSIDGCVTDPVVFLLSKKCLVEMVKGPLYNATRNCLERDLKLGGDFLVHSKVSLDIIGSLCVFELTPLWLKRAKGTVNESESILEVSVESDFGVEVVRVGWWGGTAQFVELKAKAVPSGRHAIKFDSSADECGASTNLAIEHILKQVWLIVLPKVNRPQCFLSLEGDFALKILRGAIVSDRDRLFFYHVSDDERSGTPLSVPGVREMLAKLVPELRVIIWGVRNGAGFPVFRGDEALSLNYVANFLLIPEDVKCEVSRQ